MLSRYSLRFFRTLRTPVRRTRESSRRQNVETSTVTSLSEDDLNKLMKRDEQLYSDEISTSSDVPIIDRSNFEHATENTENEYLKPKKFRMKLKEMVLQNPLTEEITEDNKEKYIVKAVTPLSLFHYQKQLRIKQKHCEDVLKELRVHLKAVKAPSSTTMNHLPCPMENIIPSPDVFSYRNMDKFSVNTGVNGNPKTVGYFIGLPRDPFMRCIPPTNLVNIKDSHKLIRQHFQKFIEESPYKACTNFQEGGVWRELIVRSNLKEELMAVVIIYPNDLTLEGKEEIKEKLNQYYFNGPGSECGLSSLYLQACSRSKCTREMAPYELIAGVPYLTEECLGKSFQISPDSFFQSNTRAAELLYGSVQKMAELSSLTTLLDVCCGTGIISILLGPQCRGAIGIDSSSSAIEDAKVNSKINKVNNARYVCGQIEKILPVLTKDLQDSSDVVAVVNPARAGLHSSVINTIRSCPSINKIIYVTCKPEGNVMKNLISLGSTLALEERFLKNVPDIGVKSPELYSPFALRYAIPVDLFPHTAHVEFILLLERVHNY